MFALALWRIEGRFVPRDLTAARLEMEQAAALGERLAARTLSALLATGIGGKRQWDASLRLLEHWQDRDEQARRQLERISEMRLDGASDPSETPVPKVLSRDPYVARFPGLFTLGECDYLRHLTQARFKPAQIFHEGRQRFGLSTPRRYKLVYNRAN